MGLRLTCAQGGSRWTPVAAFYKTMYGIASEEESAERIAAIMAQQPPNVPIIVAAHNGPTGLGDRRHDICGLDFISGKEGEALASRALHSRNVARLVGPVPTKCSTMAVVWNLVNIYVTCHASGCASVLLAC